MSNKIISIEDQDGDSFYIERSYHSGSRELFLGANQVEGVFMNAFQVKQLRKALKRWLIDNGHKEAA